MKNYFPPEELACKHCGDYHFKQDTLDRLNRLRAEHGKPMAVSSGYRCPEFNTMKGYTQTHATGQAVDIQCSSIEAIQIVKLALKHGFTGIGVKMHGPHADRFIHLDDLPVGHTGAIRPVMWSYK